MSWLKRGSAQNGNNGKAPGTYNLDDLRADVVDKISVAVMMVDRDFNVTFVNEPTRQLLRTNAAAFRAVWPNFDPDRIVGSCIDMFHRNPSHQRNLLSDPSRLPYRAEISVGDLKFALLVNASFDRDRNYVGNVLEWNDVTAVRVNEGMLAALNKAQAVIEFSVDGKIINANENFLKTMGYALDEIRGRHHSMFVEPAYRASAKYARFWEKLAAGECDANQYKPIGKNGAEIWIGQTRSDPRRQGQGFQGSSSRPTSPRRCWPIRRSKRRCRN